MLDIEGQIFGGATPVALRNRCVGLLADRSHDGHIEVLRQIVALGHARIVGMTETAGDPFTHVPSAQSALEDLSEEISAPASVSPDDWRSAYEGGIEAASRGAPADPAFLAASLLSLARYARAENETLKLYLLAAGTPVEVAEATASATVCAGLGACVLGGFETWAGQLAKTNNRSMKGLGPDAANACRVFQATTLKRFAKIRDLDDIECVNEEQLAQKIALERFSQSREGGML